MTMSTDVRLALCAASFSLIAAVAFAQSVEPAAVRGKAGSLRQCIETTFTTSWTPYDDHTILVRSGGRTFKVTTNRCSGLTSPLPQINTEFRGGSSICSPHDVQLSVSSSGLAPIPCYVQSIQPLTHDETRAMEAAGRRGAKGK